RPSCETAIAGFDRGAEPAIRAQPEDGGEVAQARIRRRCADGPEGTSLIRSQQGGGGAGRHLSPPYSAAARRLPLRPPGDDPASDAILAASLLSAPRDQPTSGGGGIQAESGVQGLSHRLLSHRHRRG